MQLSRIGVVVVLIMLAGCSSGGQIETGQLPNSPLCAFLPSLSETVRPHQASAPYYYVRLGREAYAQSEYSVASGDEMDMAPTGPDYAWTIYELGTGGYSTLSLVVELRFDSDGEDDGAYFGVSNYASETWEFGNPVDASDDYDVPLTADNVSDGDFIYLAVVSTPDSLVTLRRVTLTVDRPGWFIYTLDDTDYAGSSLMMFNQDSKPMIAYGSSNNGVIRFLRADTSFPTAPDQWTSMVVDTDPDPARVGPPLAAASVDGRPAVVYMETTEDLVKYAYSTVAEPDTLDDWVTMVVADLPAGVGQLGLADLDGVPCLAFGGPSQGLFFARASSSTPAAGNWDITGVDPPGVEDTSSSPSLAIAGGRPVIFCHGDFDDEGGAFYLRATTATPSGPADWEHHLAFGYAPGGTRNSLYIKPVKPSSYRPLASFLNDYTVASLVVNVGRIPIPLEPADWRINYIDQDVGDSAVISVDSKPFVLYSCSGEESIKCAWAHEYEPHGDEDWDWHVIEAGATGSVAAVSITNTPIVAFRDSENDVLRFGFFDE